MLQLLRLGPRRAESIEDVNIAAVMVQNLEVLKFVFPQPGRLYCPMDPHVYAGADFTLLWCANLSALFMSGCNPAKAFMRFPWQHQMPFQSQSVSMEE